MRVGLIVPQLSYHSGWAHYSQSLLEALRAVGVEVRVVAAENCAPLADVPIARVLPNLMPRARFFLPRLARALPRVRAALDGCDLAHITAEPYAPLALGLGRPVFLTVHGSYAHLPRLGPWPARALYRRAFGRARLVCVSRYTAQVVASILPSAAPSVVNNGIDAARFRQLPPPFPKTGPVILTTGGVKQRKGTLPLIEAFHRVRDHHPQARCVIVGATHSESAYGRAVLERVAQYGLTDSVAFVGRVSEAELLRWYATADVFVLPSINHGWKFEGFGLVHLEASAAGLPVIGTRECGSADAIEDGVTGLLISQSDLADALPSAILRLLQNPSLAQAMGRAGRERAERFSWGAAAQRLLALYAAALS